MCIRARFFARQPAGVAISLRPRSAGRRSPHQPEANCPDATWRAVPLGSQGPSRRKTSALCRHSVPATRS